jgi:hypothetical protein
MACGNTVAFLPLPHRAAPHSTIICRYIKPFNSRGFIVSCDIFSSRVILMRRSLILVSTGRAGFQKENSSLFFSLTSLLSEHEKKSREIIEKINNLI